MRKLLYLLALALLCACGSADTSTDAAPNADTTNQDTTTNI